LLARRPTAAAAARRAVQKSALELVIAGVGRPRGSRGTTLHGASICWWQHASSITVMLHQDQSVCPFAADPAAIGSLGAGCRQRYRRPERPRHVCRRAIMTSR
jgi:hypothetical protein